jgi:hypothetical protein
MRPTSERARPRGVSLVEVLLAGLVVALGVLPAVGVLINTGPAIQQTTPYYQAIFIGELALEELRVATREDPHFIEALLGGRGTDRNTILRGGHPVTRVLEDTKAPFGRLQPGTDWGIEPAAGPLYDLAEPLALDLDATQDADGTRVDVTLDWVDKRGRAMMYGIPTPLAGWVPLARIETLQPQPAPAAPLAAYQQLAGLGRAARAGAAALNAAAAAIQVPAAGGPPARRGLALLRKALIHESAAAAYLGYLQAMRVPVMALSSAPRDAALANVSFTERAAAVSDVRDTLNAFFVHSALAMDTAAAASRQPGLSMGQVLQCHRLVHRTAVLDALTRPWPATAPLTAFLAALVDYYKDRMPHVAHAFEVERDRAAAAATLYPLAGAAAEVLELRRNFTLAAINILLPGA